MPNKPLPPLHPVTHKPMTAEDLSEIFNMECAKQELDSEHPWIDIPEEVLDMYKYYRSTPLVRAYALEKALGTPAHIYSRMKALIHLAHIRLTRPFHSVTIVRKKVLQM